MGLTEALAPFQSGPLRSNSLAMAFQEAITVVLRVRYRVLHVGDAARFRDSMGKEIAKAGQEARRLGYSDASAQMALYAVVGFLDESVLSSQDPAFQDWGRRPMQVDLFGGAFCGEYFFRHVADLLNQPESQGCADTLELHAICLMLGFRGKYNMGESGEISSILRRIREKVARIRGVRPLCPAQPEQPIVAAPTGDPWVRRLLLTTAGIVVLTIIAFAVYVFLLSSTLNGVQAMTHEGRESIDTQLSLVRATPALQPRHLELPPDCSPFASLTPHIEVAL